MKDATRDAIMAHVEYGTPTGHFVRAVLENNLFGAIRCADEENLRDLPEIVRFVFNEVPHGSWGSRAKVLAWRERRVAEREQVSP